MHGIPTNRPPGGGEALPVAPSLEDALESADVAPPPLLVDRRVVVVSALSIVLAGGAALVAQVLTRLIGLVTNAAYYGRFSLDMVSPAGNRLGAMALFVPVVGGLVVGLMARYGSKAIRGHGIPEAMEQVLLNESRIPPRITFLKPVSAAISIGTGGPFGAEGPIIATGGALGSLVGQLLRTTAEERKTLLAAGAAAGMAATFGSPVSAVLLAVELLLFEFRIRSLIPVSLAAATAAALRMGFGDRGPVFKVPAVAAVSPASFAVYVALGALVGLFAVGVTRCVYLVEDGFEGLFGKLGVHWMWWPAIGGVVVGAVGLVVPKTLGVGYDNIEALAAGKVVGGALLLLVLFKFASWAVALGSGTSGGTLAPLLTIGAGIGAATGEAIATYFPSIGVDIHIAALVGMAGLFAGASRAVLASIVFAFETTGHVGALLPLLGGGVAAALVSTLMMRTSLMTEKIVRRGVRVPSEYAADHLDQILVRDACSRPAVTLAADQTLEEVRRQIQLSGSGPSHQGFPVVDTGGLLMGVVTRRGLLDPRAADEAKVRDLLTRAPRVVYEDNTLREAADLMVEDDIGRLPVVSRENPRRVLGFLTRSDLLSAHKKRLKGVREAERSLTFGRGEG